MNVYFWGLLASLAVYVFVGNYAGRKVKNLDDYYVTGRRSPTLLIVGTLIASFLSTNAFLAETGFAYDGYAVLMLVLVGVNSTGYVVGALFFGRFVRRSQARTIPEFFGRRFDSAAMQRLAGVTTVIGILAYLLAVTQGGAVVISDIAEIPYGAALIITWLGYMLFTMYSGSSGVVITDTIMFLIFTLAAVIALPYLLGTHAWFDVIHILATYEHKPGIISPAGLTGESALWPSRAASLTWAVILGISWSLVLAVSPWQTSRYLMAKDEHVVTRSACISGMVLAALYIFLMMGAAAINLSNDGIDQSERVMIWGAVNLLPPVLGTILIAGIMASALSSCSTFLSLIGFSISNDLFKLSSEDSAPALAITRWTMFGAATIALLLAYFQPPAILWITYFAGTLFASSWGPVAFLSIWYRKFSTPAAFTGMAAGFLVNIVAKLLDHAGIISLPVYLDPFILGFVANIVCILIINPFTRPTEKSVQYHARMHRTPQQEYDRSRVRGTTYWTVAVMVAGIAISACLLVLYALPYADAVGEEFSLFAAPSLLAVGYGFSVFLMGLLAFVTVRRAYGAKNGLVEQ